MNFDASQLPSTQFASQEDFDRLGKGAGFLGRLQLYTKGTAVNKRLIGPGEFGIPEGEDTITVLGDVIDVLPITRRPKAIDMSDKEAILTSYDANSDLFKDIAARSSGQDSGCMYGISFLVIERTTGQLLEFFCGTKSTRPEAGKIAPFLPLSQADIDRKAAAGHDVSKMEPHGPLPMTMKSKLVEKGTYSWHVPVVLPCSTPFTKLPKEADIYAEAAKFVTAKGTEVEAEKPAPASGKRRR
jgi:hypothetical protein